MLAYILAPMTDTPFSTRLPKKLRQRIKEEAANMNTTTEIITTTALERFLAAMGRDERRQAYIKTGAPYQRK